jgi:uncharacterized delta-60 repeat protein
MKPRLSGNILLFLCIFLLVACGSGSGDDVRFDCPDGEKGENWVWTGKVCSLRKDGFNWSVSSIAPALDGSDDLYAVGSFTHFKKRAVEHIARLNNDGSLDRGFDSDTGFFSPQIIVSAIDGSGDVYLGGYLSYNGPTLPIRGIARLNLDGSLDTSFDTGAGIGRMVSAIVLATDGSGDVYVGGLSSDPVEGSTFENGPIRLNSDGSHDTDFNSGFRAGEKSIVPAADGSGDIYVSRSSAPYIARLNNDGSIETDFDTGPSGFDRSVWDIAVATDGSGDIYVAGNFNEYNGTSTMGLARLNSDGSFDTGFVVDTRVFHFQGGAFVLPAVDGSGDVYAHVTNTNDQDVVRLNDDGSIDTGFSIGEGFNYNGSLSDTAITTDGSGDIYVAGGFTHYNSKLAVNLVRLTAGGAIVR